MDFSFIKNHQHLSQKIQNALYTIENLVHNIVHRQQRTLYITSSINMAYASKQFCFRNSNFLIYKRTLLMTSSINIAHTSSQCLLGNSNARKHRILLENINAERKYKQAASGHQQSLVSSMLTSLTGLHWQYFLKCSTFHGCSSLRPSKASR